MPSSLPVVSPEVKSTRVICMGKFFIQNSCVSCNFEQIKFFDLDFFGFGLDLEHHCGLWQVQKVAPYSL